MKCFVAIYNFTFYCNIIHDENTRNGYYMVFFYGYKQYSGMITVPKNHSILIFTARHFVSKTRAFSRKGYEPNSPVFSALGFFRVPPWTMVVDPNRGVVMG